jgi:hypothetical protein
MMERQRILATMTVRILAFNADAAAGGCARLVLDDRLRARRDGSQNAK